jgi:hypothetical protein
MITNCYICSVPCTDWGLSYYSCCPQCSADILEEEGMLRDYSENGFPDSFDEGIAKLKSRIKIRSNKKYSNECPCGIHPSDCEYHK